MDQARWQQVKRLLEQGIAAGPARRSEILASAADDALREEVRSLLRAHDETGGPLSLLEAPHLAPEGRGLPDAGAPPDALLGTQVGPYRLVRLLGQGGMGVVYLGERVDPDFQRRVAIKMLHQQGEQEPLQRQLRKERQILAALDHPHIARLIDGGATAEGRPYLIMEYIEGRSLTTYASVERLSITERLRLFLPVCSAVHYAHQRQIVHCDLKPGNILVTFSGHPKLVDFGVARLLNPLHGTLTGPLRALTPAYASPEQLRGEPAGPASDVYSLCLVLHELLTGELPQGPAGIRVGAELGAIIQRGTTPEPRGRYRSAQELHDAIARYLEQHRPAPARPRPPRRLRLALLIGGAGLLVLGAGGLRQFMTQREPAPLAGSVRARPVGRAEVGAGPLSPAMGLHRDLIAMHRHALALLESGDLRGALAAFEENSRTNSALLAQTPGDVMARRAQVRLYRQLAQLRGAIAEQASTPLEEKVTLWQKASADHERALTLVESELPRASPRGGGRRGPVGEPGSW